MNYEFKRCTTHIFLTKINRKYLCFSPFISILFDKLKVNKYINHLEVADIDI